MKPTTTKRGPEFWKSLDEWSDTAEFRQWLDREFPVAASEWDDPEGRRHFLKLMGASLALAGVGAACTRQPTEKIVPYVKAPEEIVPGRPLYYATAVRQGGYAKGVLVESHMGRPTKVEGNPEHPASLGAADVFGQAEVLTLYDPDRSQTLKLHGEVQPWASFVEAMRQALATHKPQKGAGVRILTENVTSPTLISELESLLATLPEARWHVWEPLARDNSQDGATLAFGTPVDVQYRLDRADVIVSLDADFMTERPDNLALIRAFSARRRVTPPNTVMSRLYAVDSASSLTGANADHRIPLRAGDVLAFASALGAAVDLPLTATAADGRHGNTIAAIAEDLRAHAGSAVVMAGETQPPIVHAIAHAINDRLGNVGRTVVYTKQPPTRAVAGRDSLAGLIADMTAGKVDLLLILGGNPVYSAPADSGFRAALARVGQRVHLGLYDDETADECDWHVPAAHDFETWGDARALDGTATIQQPLIQPLYGGKSPLEVLATLSDRPQRTPHDIVRDYWRAHWAGSDFEHEWRKALHDGLIAGSTAEVASVVLGKQALEAPKPAAIAGIEIVFRPDPSVGDGRYANNGWLQELPRPLTKVTWDNVALLSPKTAVRLGVSTGDVVRLTYATRSVTGPAYVMPGHPDESVTVHLGYGRTHAGRVGGDRENPVGFSAYALRTSDRPWFGSGLLVEKTGERARLAVTQDHWSISDPGGSVEDRGIIRVVNVRKYQADPEVVREMGEDPAPDQTLYPAMKYDGHRWAMSIDLNACVGCNACITACQSENNIPVVGKDQVARGREMHWLRVDRYFRGDPQRSESVEAHFAPIPCMQCENAPCEVVCPVGATVHSDEGLNDMVYNRCVGTKYCSNNCPYKVRRFNFLLYQDWDTPSLKFLRNPDVTVRSRGVMEKCTYCVQRINHARIDAKVDGRAIRDGEIQTACQQACPSQAIVFGDLSDPGSQVVRQKGEPRNYGLLTDLNTRPRTTYLAALRNPNPEIQSESETSHG